MHKRKKKKKEYFCRARCLSSSSEIESDYLHLFLADLEDFPLTPAVPRSTQLWTAPLHAKGHGLKTWIYLQKAQVKANTHFEHENIM